MLIPPSPENELERLASLYATGLLDSLPEKELDDITHLASYICQVPIALISLVDRDRQWFKSKVGLDTVETSRQISFCGHTILDTVPLVVADAQNDERFADNPLVVNDPAIRFYAGVPISVDPNLPLGSLCVIDRVPRRLQPDQLEALNALARQIGKYIELRMLRTKLIDAYEQLERLNHRLAANNKRLEAELDVARTLQQAILPRTSELLNIPELDIAGSLKAATEVGGDYFDVMTADGFIRIGIGDVTGHGLESGIIMLMAQAAVRSLTAAGVTDPRQSLCAVNQTIFDNVRRMGCDKNLSLLLVDYQSGWLTVMGQHEEVLIAHADGSLETIDTLELGFPLGLEADISQFVGSIAVPLPLGDVVVLYTDGITEAINQYRDFFGKERLSQILSAHLGKSSETIRREIIQALHEFIGAQVILDDITLVVLQQRLRQEPLIGAEFMREV